MPSLDEILDKLETQTSFTREELMERIDKKYEELSGLITREGAAYIVAKELGVDIPSERRKRLEMRNVISGMKNVNVVGRVFRISPINEFQRHDGSKGKVVNLFVGDDTGYVRLPLWNEQVELVENESIQLGDTIQIVNGLARENIFGDIEISLGRFGSIREVEDTTGIPSVEDLNKIFLTSAAERTLIKDLTPGNFEIKATIVKIFKGNFLFDTCPMCDVTVKEVDGKYICEEHGEIEPNPALVISCIADDSTGNIRVVFFRNLAENLCDVTAEELSKLDKDKRYELIRERLLGKELILTGRVRKNKIFDRLELMVNEVKDLNVLEESKKLVEEIESRVVE